MCLRQTGYRTWPRPLLEYSPFRGRCSRTRMRERTRRRARNCSGQFRIGTPLASTTSLRTAQLCDCLISPSLVSLARGGAWNVPQMAIPVIGTNGLGSRDFSRWCQSGLYRQRAGDVAFLFAPARQCEDVKVSMCRGLSNSPSDVYWVL
jgi:hypothetical protein